MAHNQFFKQPEKRAKSRKQVGDYILEKAIGFGAFSTVYEGSSISAQEKVAVKSINLHRINVSDKHLSNLKQEIDILRKCRHSNIVQLLHTYQTSNHIYLVMQYCCGGDLHRFIQRNGKMSEEMAQKFSIQLKDGLKYLHSLKIIHRDLKPQNILLSSHNLNTAILRIADFGFARYKPTGHNMVDTMCGSPLYMAPEILKFNKYDSKVDLWSAGTIIYQMCTKDPPFNGSNHIELLKKIENCKRLRFPQGLSDNCKDLIIRLLKRNPKQRISWDQFFTHKWFETYENKSKKINKLSKSPSNTPRTKLKNTTPSPFDETESDNNTLSPKGIPKNNKILAPKSDFIMINKDSNQKMNSKIYTEFANNSDSKFGEIFTRFEYAKCIMKVGDVQCSEEQISCALLLYLRGLDILEGIITAIHGWIGTYVQSLKYFELKLKGKNKSKYIASNERLKGFALQYKQLLLDSIGTYDIHWKRGEAIQTLCATDALQFDAHSDRVNIDEVIFGYAMGSAKKSCSDIVLGVSENKNFESVMSRVNECRLLLQYLMGLDSIDGEDKQSIGKYLDAVKKTLGAIEKLRS